MGRHESNESDEGSKGDESHEGYESQEGLCAAGQASRLRWEVNQDAKWAEEIRFGEDQGLRRHQEGFPALQQGKGTLQKEVIRCGSRMGARGSSTVDNTSCC